MEFDEKPPINPSYKPAAPSLEMDLPGDNRIEIHLRRKVDKKDWSHVKKIFELAELSFVNNDIV